MRIRRRGIRTLAAEEDHAEHVEVRYATIKVDDHVETWPVKSSGFGHWIRRQFYLASKRAPAAQAFNDAVRLIASVAIFDGEQRTVFVRLAEHGSSIYLDLVNDNWQVVRITGESWEVIDAAGCPVRFVRRRGMGALPMPVRGGHINELRPFVNCPTADLWVLYAGSLPALFRARGPYPGLAVTGEQGSGPPTRSATVVVSRVRSQRTRSSACSTRPGDDRSKKLADSIAAGERTSRVRACALRPWPS